ncbi:MAG: hypothetical protein FWD91_06675 [Treponema sp.]|nr:hypothetical protein [Treponema sp.]
MKKKLLYGWLVAVTALAMVFAACGGTPSGEIEGVVRGPASLERTKPATFEFISDDTAGVVWTLAGADTAGKHGADGTKLTGESTPSVTVTLGKYEPAEKLTLVATKGAQTFEHTFTIPASTWEFRIANLANSLERDEFSTFNVSWDADKNPGVKRMDLTFEPDSNVVNTGTYFSAGAVTENNGTFTQSYRVYIDSSQATMNVNGAQGMPVVARSRSNRTVSQDLYGLSGAPVGLTGTQSYNGFAVIDGGNEHTLAITYTKAGAGRLWTWGRNDKGQLGLGFARSSDVKRHTAPTPVDDDISWRKATGAEASSAGISENNRLYTWGWGTYGNLGHGDTSDYHRPKLVVMPGDRDPNPDDADDKGDYFQWVSVVQSQDATMAISMGADGKTLAAGTGSIPSRIELTTGKLYAWGNNSSGQLGLGDKKTPITNRKPQEVSGGKSDWKRVSLGYNHAVAIDAAGDLYTWGANSRGQLGHGNKNDSYHVPTKVNLETGNWKVVYAAWEFTIGITKDGKLYSWGSADNGALARSVADGDSATPTEVAHPVQGKTWWDIKLNAQARQVLALDVDYKLYSWGFNQFSQLGRNSADATNNSDAALAGTAKAYHHVVMQVHDSSGLPLADLTNTGGWSSQAIKRLPGNADNGTIWAWGDNRHGGLGYPTTDKDARDNWKPTKVDFTQDWQSFIPSTNP